MVPASFAVLPPANPVKTELQVRCVDARRDELVEASHLLCEAFLETEVSTTVFLALTQKEYNRLQANHQQTKHRQIFATSLQGDKIGYVDLDARDHRGDEAPYVSDLAVRPEYRRRGVATQLLLHCEAIATEWNYPSIFLKVNTSHPGTLQLYANLGYEVYFNDHLHNNATLRKDLTRMRP